MARPLSLDLRCRVAVALAEGSTMREAAKRFGVSVASAVRIGQHARAGHGLAARKIGGNPPPVLLGAAHSVRSRLATKQNGTAEPRAAADALAQGSSPL